MPGAGWIGSTSAHTRGHEQSPEVIAVKKNLTPEVHTARLRLIPGTAAMVKAALNDHARLAEGLAASVPENWPAEDLREVLPQFYDQMVDNPALENWVVWFWVRRGERGAEDVLIGDAGFLGLPDDNGSVEIGYSILSQFRRHGYAREGVAGLLAVAFTRPEITMVMAETRSGNAASIGVLEKFGFCRINGADKSDSTWFAMTRQEYEKRIDKDEVVWER